MTARVGRGVTTGPSLIASLLADLPTAAGSIPPPFLASLEQLCFYEQPDLAPLIPSLPASFSLGLFHLLRSPPNVRIGRGLFTVRSLSTYAFGRLSSLDSSFKRTVITRHAALLPALLLPLDERSPFSHVTALNLLVDWTDEAVVAGALFTAGAVEKAVAVYQHHARVPLTKKDEEGREAQRAIAVFAVALLSRLSVLPAAPPALLSSGAVYIAGALLHDSMHEPLLLPSLQLLHAVLSAAPSPPPLPSPPPFHVGDIAALTTHSDADLAHAANAVLARTPLGQRVLAGEAVDKATLGEAEYAVFERAMARVQRGDVEEELHDTCAACGKEELSAGAFAKCGRCRAVRYCGKACQTGHWKEHKSKCAKPATS